MLSFTLRRLLEMIVTLLILSMLVFGMLLAAPGDPAVALLGRAAARPENQELLERLRREMGLDQPVYVQYLRWIGRVIQGDLGVSNRNGEAVITLIASRLPATFQLLVCSTIISLIIAIPLAVAAALRRGSWLDQTLVFLSVAGVAIPGFWLGLILILVFSVYLGWLPPSGYTSLFEDPVDSLRRSVMPVITLSVYLIAAFSRFLRSDLIEVLSQDYIRTAYAKGLSRRMVMWRHAMKNALPSLWTMAGIEVGTLLGGVIIIEQVFGWSGIGWLAVQAVNNRDYPLVLGIVMVVAAGFSLITLITDLGYAWLNPELRHP
ncbi:MAG: ABC transporter permease [Roseiflexaceae bacterium]|nr:ABC transporter permease [Roseiflexus sp.]MDW8214796.1 ABC transporter permease [Roseiflexaceae bacterium]